MALLSFVSVSAAFSPSSQSHSAELPDDASLTYPPRTEPVRISIQILATITPGPHQRSPTQLASATWRQRARMPALSSADSNPADR